MLLRHRGLWAVVSNPEQVLAVSRASQSEKAQALIGMHVSDLHLRDVFYAESAQAAWMSLKMKYNAVNSARVLDLKVQMDNLRKQPNESMTA